MKHFPVMFASLLVTARNRAALLEPGKTEPITVRIPAARDRFGRIMAAAVAGLRLEGDGPWEIFLARADGSGEVNQPPHLDAAGLPDPEALEPAERKAAAKLTKAIRMQAAKAAQISWKAFAAGKRAPITVEILPGHSVGALKGSTAVLTTSGTSVLETGFLRKAMAILYRVSEVSYRIYKPMATVTQLGIVNILAGRTFCQEYIQHDVTAEKVAPELERLLFDDSYRRGIEQTLNEVVGPLDKGDPHPAIVAQILDYLS